MSIFGGRSYAQHGDDMVLACVLYRIGIVKPSYLDVGAYHPTEISNTAAFYAAGSRGINVDVDPGVIELFKKERPDDVNVCACVAPAAGKLTLYSSSEAPTIRSCVRPLLEMFGPVTGERVVEATTLQEIVDRHAGGKFPDLLNVDAEGLDLDILRSVDLAAEGPKVICVEALFVQDHEAVRAHLEAQGYEFVFRCVVNDVYVRQDLWRDAIVDPQP